MGGAESTYFKLENKTVKEMTTNVTWTDSYDYYVPYRPDMNLDNLTLKPDEVIRKREDLYTSANGHKFHIELRFNDEHRTKLALKIDQGLAIQRKMDNQFEFSGDTKYYLVTKCVRDKELCVTIKDSVFGLQEIEDLKLKNREAQREKDEEQRRKLNEILAREEEETRRKEAEEQAALEEQQTRERALQINKEGVDLLDQSEKCEEGMREVALRKCVEAVNKFDKAAEVSLLEEIRKSFVRAIEKLKELDAYDQAAVAEEKLKNHFPNAVGLLPEELLPQFEGIRLRHLDHQEDEVDLISLQSF